MPWRRTRKTATAECTVVQAAADGPLVDWPELWRYRELLAFLAWRDIRVRYRQTLLGALWALLEPLLPVVLFTLIFNRLAGIKSGATPYLLFCYAGMLVWTFFARSLRGVTVSLVANSGLITKAYFPRLVLPLASQMAALLDLLCAGLLYVVLAWYYGVVPGLAALTVPLWVLLATLNALGVGLLLAAINVRYRDISQTVPLLTQVWLFATPVVYPLTAVPGRWLGVYLLNPLVSAVEGMRWALLPDYVFHVSMLLPNLLTAVLLAWVGLVWFQRSQRRFADIV